ncbi:hypothetical protein MKQ68_02840 [Chitinophaga horti]|uniref:DUF4440 domain-containing protein n=1 Tax=Chitinophaga horti TaxID=2920382 RepID=A0ABY6J2Y6_9BACT|nr:hypothetical protein [Chitinophaga horti]UYQ94026.1 hypothetical protein MKQ68_02840 [Chitinophaga horti]
MKHWPLLLLLLFTAPLLHAQDVVTAERAFAQLAIDSSVKTAFLRFADSNGVVFDQGNILPAIKTWSSFPDKMPLFYWQPAFAAMSYAGDLGFTTGPYEVKASATDTPLVCGHYTTVWKKNAQGEWKFMADMGTRYEQSLYGKQSLQHFTDLVPSGQPDSAIYLLEKKLILAHDSLADEAFRFAAADSAWFNIEGVMPVQGIENIMNGLRQVPVSLRFEPVAGGISQRKDLAYVYGTVKYNQRKETYLRIWAHTSKGWKLLVQVLHW